MDDLQFYPITKELARQLYDLLVKDEDYDFSRILDPSAGRGDLLKYLIEFARQAGNWRRIHAEACEFDVNHQSALREASVNIVGHDFLQFRAGAPYSCIVMNPPFRFGAEHVLHAWDIAYDAQIAAVINAETLRNPYTAERKRLVALIEQHGTAQFVQGAFSEAERETDVEVALVHLRKRGDSDSLTQRLTEGLHKDQGGEFDGQAHLADSDVAIPNSAVENYVLAFDAALTALRESLEAQARAHNSALRLGTLLTTADDSIFSAGPHTQSWVREQYAEEYDRLKERAWATVLRSTQVASKISASVQQRLERDFEQIKTLEFTVTNVHGFLLGLAQSASDLQRQMCCDTFDLVSRYHSDNLSFYRGWKSNDLHHRLGRRIKMTRFIIPGYPNEHGNRSFDRNGLRMLYDIDQTFALLDGKRLGSAMSDGLEAAFCQRLPTLRSGERVSTRYFDVRYYQGIGTIHFFPKRKDLVDRLNRVVGAYRRWLPPDNEPRVPEAFWLAYEASERLSEPMMQAAAAILAANQPSGRRVSMSVALDPDRAFRRHESESLAMAYQAWDQASEQVLREAGLDFDAQLQANAPVVALPAPGTQLAVEAANDGGAANAGREDLTERPRQAGG